MALGELREYQGGAFCPRLPGGKAAGVVELTWQCISCSCQSQRVELPLSGLVIQRGGARNRLVFFSHPSSPDVSIYTADRSILNCPELNELPELAEQLRRLRSKKRRGLLATGLILAAIGAGIYGLYLLKEPVVGAVVRQIPVSVEEKLGETVIAGLRGQRRFVEDEELLVAVRDLVEPLLAAVRAQTERDYTFEFHIVEDATLNAFALPGGQVTLHTGLILAVEKPEEILGVLAHEFAHVTRQHGMRQLVGSAGVFVLVQALLGDASGVLALIMDNSSFLLSRKFSRDYERDADRTGWEYLLASRTDPRGMIDFFARLRKQREAMLGDAQKVLSIFSTHPATAERIEALEKRWRQLERRDHFREFGPELDALKTQVRQALRTRREKHEGEK